MALENKRYIDIDLNTRVGFNYIKQKYYVTNKEYTTYRPSVAEIQEVLHALEITSITDVELLALKDFTEDLYKVTYTLQDSGAYVHTLQFNDFADYPLTIDCEKKKLYVMNSTIIYDLTLNESPRNVRIPRILSFYKNTLGLLISTENMRYFYSLLLSYYYPTCYNQVTYNEDNKRYFYNNKFLLSNYSGTSDATYTCTYNPNNDAENTQVGYVVGTNTTDNTITLSAPITTEDLKFHNKVIIQGATTTIDGDEYSADGEYTVTHIGGSALKVAETIPFAYEFPYKECYILAAQYTLTGMNRSARTITLQERPDAILVGDVIIVSGATVPDGVETISCNGSYTVESIMESIVTDGNDTVTTYVITVEEEIPTDFVGEATLIKEVFVSNISEIQSKEMTFTDATTFDLTSRTILVHTMANGETTIENYTVSAQPSSATITVEEDIDDYNYIDTCPKLYIPVPDPTVNTEVLIDVTSVSEGAQEVFPMGEFMVDSFEQCQNYIRTLAGLRWPSVDIKSNLYNEVPPSIELVEIPDLTTSIAGDTIGCSIASMEFKGLYSMIYTE